MIIIKRLLNININKINKINKINNNNNILSLFNPTKIDKIDKTNYKKFHSCIFLSNGKTTGTTGTTAAGTAGTAAAGDDSYRQATLMCKYASEGDISKLNSLLGSGTSINIADYDKRTALHLAASDGRLEMVQFLVESGANINAVDRWGGTALQDAIRAHHSLVATYLREKGGKASLLQSKSATNAATAAICQAAASGDIQELKDLVEIGATVNVSDYDKRTPLHLAASEGNIEAVTFLLENGANPNAIDRFGNNPLSDALKANKKDVIDILISRGAKQIIVDTDIVAPELSPDLKPIVPLNHLRDSFNVLLGKGVFSPSCLLQETDYYYNKLRMRKFYFHRFSPIEVAYHINAYIASRQNDPSEVNVKIEKNGHGFYMTNAVPEKMSEIEKSINVITDSWEKTRRPTTEEAHSLIHFLSSGMATPYGSKPLAVYILDAGKYNSQEKPSPKETRLDLVASAAFMENAQDGYKQQCQKLMNEVVNRNSPLIHIQDTYHDGTIPVMLGFRRNSVNTSMWRISELLTADNIVCKRKYAHTFSNGINVYTLFMHPRPLAEINEFVSKLSLLFTVPPGHLTDLYIKRVFGADEYAYATAATKFVYYFLRSENEDMKALAIALENNPVNSTRLSQLRNKMKRDAITENAIASCVGKYPELIKLIFQDFKQQTKIGLAEPEVVPFNNGWPVSSKVDRFNKEIFSKVLKNVDNENEQAILREMLNFNAHVLKTNFFKYPKSSMAFRLDPSFMGESGGAYKKIPFGIFMVMANDFQGFHVRFNDVARGGIRIIRSANRSVYERNTHSLFMENYNLANTQNDKNKDLPEYGSKGTILLHRETQEHATYAFRKYISGIIDLITPNEKVLDRYGHRELLFMGPDEGTADLMEWAALYSKDRGYEFWKSFTTGKPQHMGGVPHDIYGMTTRSVHKFVTESLHKLGLEEEHMTKVMTGGPDGDLGSNEILISKDKTLAIIDGSGVLYDPQGLNREELTRLAHSRSPVEKFDSSKLSPGGYLVLVSEKDRTLPSGEVVDNGMIFRNEFHLRQDLEADLFVPCGGRPEAVNGSNVHRMFKADGTPRFKVITEGANLFFSQEARLTLEKAGVVHFKDASANKGGVTSSSLEVLSGLAMTEEEHAKYMCVKDGVAPEFYKLYVNEIQNRIELNASLEFNALWSLHHSTGVPRAILTELLSEKINVLKTQIQTSNLWDDERVRRTVLSKAIPKSLLDLLGLDAIIQRVPVNYTKAIFGAYLAGRYVYKYGLTPNEFSFYQFMNDEQK